MSSISSIIEVFKMHQIEPKTRQKVIKKLGIAINHEFASNVTDDLVEELLQIIDLEIKESAKWEFLTPEDK